MAACAVVIPACNPSQIADFLGQSVPESMTISSTPASGTALVGKTVQFAIVVLDNNGKVMDGQTVTWSIFPSDVATIDQTGRATCIAVGSTIAHALGPDNGSGVNLTADAPLHCVAPAPVPTTMTITTPATGTVVVPFTRQYTIDVRDQNNAPITPQTAAWSIVGTAGIATISPSGLATCVAVGTVTVHAVGPLNGSGVNLTADASLQCVAASGNAAAAIVLTPWTVTASFSAVSNGTATTVASFRDSNGQPTTNGCPVGFAIDASAVASVNSSGLTATVTAVGAGTTILRAFCNSGPNLSAMARVQSTQAPLNVAKVVMATRFVYFPAATQANAFQFVATAQDVNGTAIPSAVMAFAITGGSAASVDGVGNVTVTASTGPSFRGGSVLTATSGGQKEYGFVTYGDAGTIRGQVTSTLGQYVGVGGTDVSATNNSSGTVTAAGGITNDGFFYIVGLVAGTYTVSVTPTNTGLTQTFTGVVVTAGQQTVVTPTPFP